MDAAIKVENVSKSYRSKRQVVEAVKHVSLEVPKGTIVALLGPNGSGKTTLMKAMCGLVYPDEGDIWIQGYSIRKERKQALHSLGVILEGERNIYYYLTVFDNLFYFGTLNRISKSTLISRIDHLLEVLQLDEKRNTYASELSRGMQQKLALGITLLKDPDILLLDEPTLGLDVQASHDLLMMIEQMAKEGKTIILTTHQLELAERISDAIILFQNGQVLTYQQKSELLEKYNNQLMVELTVHEDDSEKMNQFIGNHRDENNRYVLSLLEFESIMADMKQQRIRIIDLNKRATSLEEIFLELVGEKRGHVVRTSSRIL
jgi:ABC-2 type transport system ATP-binding protein